jgi:uncharacterized protein YjgD (DUF1641 family)
MRGEEIMAQPILLNVPRRDPHEELRSRLAHAPAQHAEAVLAAYEVLQGLHDQGVLELLRGMLGGRDKVLEIAVEAAKTPEAIRGIRNLLVMAKIVSSIDPEFLEKVAQAVPEAIVGAARAEQEEPPTFWRMWKIVRGKDLRRGFVAVNSMLAAWGRSFAAERGQ